MIPIHTLRTAMIVFLGTVLTTGALFSLFVAHQAALERSTAWAELEQLREENQAQQFHIQRFADQVNRMNKQLAKLQNYYARLKILTQLDLEEHTDAATAAGGPQPRDSEMDIYLEKNLKRHISRIHWELEELQMGAEIQEQNAHRIENFFDSQRSLLAATPTIWPVRGWVTSRFGHRRSPFTGTLQLHEGIDIGARRGTPVKATADGIVIYAGWKAEYGKMVTLDHGYGFRTRYGHLDTLHVRSGQRVTRGGTIGTVGTTGKSTGPHLHYEVRLNNVPTNPKTYLLN
jgi:murein DD-endopeptidase MepM/ murein hydrolase activator NlpD